MTDQEFEQWLKTFRDGGGDAADSKHAAEAIRVRNFFLKQIADEKTTEQHDEHEYHALLSRLHTHGFPRPAVNKPNFLNQLMEQAQAFFRDLSSLSYGGYAVAASLLVITVSVVLVSQRHDSEDPYEHIGGGNYTSAKIPTMNVMADDPSKAADELIQLVRRHHGKAVKTVLEDSSVEVSGEVPVEEADAIKKQSHPLDIGSDGKFTIDFSPPPR